MDRVRGGGGADTFLFGYGEYEGAGNYDRILDFNAAEGDKIDLREMDADINSAETDEAFVIVGGFTHVAGQLRISAAGANWRVSGDVDGDGLIDLDILVTSTAALTAGDFLL